MTVAKTPLPDGVTRLRRGELCNELSQAASNLYILLVTANVKVIADGGIMTHG